MIHINWELAPIIIFSHWEKDLTNLFDLMKRIGYYSGFGFGKQYRVQQLLYLGNLVGLFILDKYFKYIYILALFVRLID